jgi:hypothetical protein
MPKITASQLDIPASAKFFLLPSPLTATFVRATLKALLLDAGGKAIGAPEIRVRLGTGADIAHYTFQCVRFNPPISFLKDSKLREERYGFVLLIERRGYLAVFTRGVTGADNAFTAKTKRIPRDAMTHVWGATAKYQKLSTRRMNIGRTELRGVQFEGDDLQNSMPFGAAGRSIPQSFRLHVPGESTRAVTPSTGRVQKAGEKSALASLVEFVDELADALAANPKSAFLSAFSTPLELHDLPPAIAPTGLLLDLAELHDFLSDVETAGVLLHPTETVAVLLDRLSVVFDVQADPGDATKWIAVSSGSTAAKLKRLTGSYGLLVEATKGWSIEDGSGKRTPLERWFQNQDAFSVSYSDPEYFYTRGSLYKRAGFAKEANYVLGLLSVHSPLDAATSEKGPTGSYGATTTNFGGTSIFRVLETSLSADPILICTDLNDEWADYLGVSANEVTFYHCKDGNPTSGASPFQIVVAQALKNLSRVKFRPEEIQEKLEDYAGAPMWTSKTAIPRLVRGNGDWTAVISSATTAAGSAIVTWRVALVVTALSRAQFAAEMQLPTPKPYFIQLVWLLSAFASSCKEKDAKPVIFCRS